MIMNFRISYLNYPVLVIKADPSARRPTRRRKCREERGAEKRKLYPLRRHYQCLRDRGLQNRGIQDGRHQNYQVEAAQLWSPESYVSKYSQCNSAINHQSSCSINPPLRCFDNLPSSCSIPPPLHGVLDNIKVSWDQRIAVDIEKLGLKAIVMVMDIAPWVDPERIVCGECKLASAVFRVCKTCTPWLVSDRAKKERSKSVEEVERSTDITHQSPDVEACTVPLSNTKTDLDDNLELDLVVAANTEFLPHTESVLPEADNTNTNEGSTDADGSQTETYHMVNTTEGNEQPSEVDTAHVNCAYEDSESIIMHPSIIQSQRPDVTVSVTQRRSHKRRQTQTFRKKTTQLKISSSQQKKIYGCRYGYKVHRCGICQKGFRSDVTLKSHLNIHYVVPRYQCTVCMHRFTSDYFLQRHLRASRHGSCPTQLDTSPKIIQSRAYFRQPPHQDACCHHDQKPADAER